MYHLTKSRRSTNIALVNFRFNMQNEVKKHKGMTFLTEDVMTAFQADKTLSLEYYVSSFWTCATCGEFRLGTPCCLAYSSPSVHRNLSPSAKLDPLLFAFSNIG